MPELSVIVPIFNGEDSLHRCVDSILSQTYIDFELILIDDGSTDSSLKICQEYANKDRRVIVVHKENSGLVAARKTGLDCAKGNYIGFVDCDDYIDETMYYNLISVVQKDDSDIVVGGIIFEYADHSKVMINSLPAGFYSHKDIRELIIPKMLVYSGFVNYGIVPGVVVKIFKRNILLKSLPYVSDSVTLGEDVSITAFSILSAESLSIINSSDYHYVQNDNSMVRKYDANRIIKIKTLYNCLSQVENISYQKQVEIYMCSQIFKSVGKCIKCNELTIKEKRLSLKAILRDEFSVSIFKQVDLSSLSSIDKAKVLLMKYRFINLLIWLLRR